MMFSLLLVFIFEYISGIKMYVININIKECLGAEEYCLLLPTLSSASVVSFVKAVLSLVFTNIPKKEDIIKDGCAEKETLKDLMNDVLGLNNVSWQPPQSVYDNMPEEPVARPVISGDIPLQLFDKVMQRLEKAPADDLSDKYLPPIHDIVELDSVAERTLGDENPFFQEVEHKIRKVDLSKYDLPKAADVVCPVCGKVFLSAVYLRRHFFNHTNTKEKPNYCRACDEWISDKRLFEKHQNYHKERFVWN